MNAKTVVWAGEGSLLFYFGSELRPGGMELINCDDTCGANISQLINYQTSKQKNI